MPPSGAARSGTGYRCRSRSRPRQASRRLAHDIRAPPPPRRRPTSPPDSPCRRARPRAVRSAVSVGTSTTASGTEGSYSAGRCGVVARCLSPSSPCRGESGCTPTSRTAGVLLLQKPARSHHGSGRSHRGHEVGDASFGLRPDLGPGRLSVGARVGRIAVLIGVEVAVGQLGHQLAGALGRPVGAFQPVGENHFGTVDLEQRACARDSRCREGRS